MLIDLVVLALSIVAVSLGADLMVTSASRLAGRLGIHPLVIGLTVVAFGTSAPELVVSATAAWRGQAGLALGNVMGSTVANVALIIGLGAIFRPIDVDRRLLVRESPLLVAVLIAVMVLSFNNALGRIDGLALVAGFVLYLVFLVRWGLEGRAPTPDPGERLDDRAGLWGDLLRFGVGLAGLLLGGNWLVDAATAVAFDIGVSEEVIGATIVAVGTTVPELASSLAAVRRGLGDLAVGNVIGSNVFNLGFVLGISALVGDMQLPQGAVVRQVVPAMLACLVLIPLAWRTVRRPAGVALLLGYAAYVWWIL